MDVAELIREAKKLPEKELHLLAQAVGEAAAAAVDARFEQDVLDGRFDAMAAEALNELKSGRTVSLHEVLDERGVS